MKRPLLAALALGLTATWTAAVEVVFSTTARWERDPTAAPSTYTLAVAVTVDEGWHVNSHTPLSEDLIPTTLRLELPAGWSAGDPVYPKHRTARFEFSD